MVLVRVNCENGENHWIETGRTIDELRKKIWRATGVPWAKSGGMCSSLYGGQCQRIFHRGVELPPEGRIASLGLVNGDVLQLVEDKSQLQAGATYLTVAMMEGETEVVQDMIEKDPTCLQGVQDDTLNSAISLATSFGANRLVESLIGVGEDCNVGERSGKTPLHCAAQTCVASDTVEALECGGANMNAVFGGNWCPLHFVMIGEERPSVSMMMMEGGTINMSPCKITPMHNASMDPRGYRMVEEFLSVGEGVGQRLPNEVLPIDLARSAYNQAAIDALMMQEE